MNQIVTGCSDCPFNHEHESHHWCKHEKSPYDSDINPYRVNVPDWCPLKLEPLTLTFKSDG